MAEIESISVVAADLSGISYLGERLDRVFGSKDTKLSRELSFDQSHYSKLWGDLRTAQNHNDLELERKTLATMKENDMFPNWFPFDASDGARGWALAKFKEKMNLTAWPHVE